MITVCKEEVSASNSAIVVIVESHIPAQRQSVSTLSVGVAEAPTGVKLYVSACPFVVIENVCVFVTPPFEHVTVHVPLERTVNV